MIEEKLDAYAPEHAAEDLYELNESVRQIGEALPPA